MARCPSCGGRSGRGEHAACGQSSGGADGGPAATGALPEQVPGFELLARIGHGGFGAVYSARRLRDGSPAAVKLAEAREPSAARRLRREAEVLRAVGPPHVPRVFDSGDLASGAPYLAMELIELPTFAQRLAEQAGPMAPAEVPPLALPLAGALAALHRAGFAHRDLKPENVFIGADKAVLIDFGLALGNSGELASRLTAADEEVGSSYYMSPERCEGEPGGPASDVYAFGVMLFELVTGRPPFHGAEAEVRISHRLRRPPAASEIAPAAAPLDGLIARCLAKSPPERPTAADLAGAIAAASPSSQHVRSARSNPRRAVPCGVLFADGDIDVAALGRILEAHRGELVGLAGRIAAAVFLPGAAGQPVRRAVRAAEASLAEAGASRAMVDRMDVSVRTGRRGIQVLTPLAERGAELLAGAGRGLSLTDAARAGLGRDAGPASSSAVDGRAPLFGREAIVEHLAGAAARAIDARAPAVVEVVGPIGIGKSRVCGALASAVEETRTVIDLALPEPAAGDPYRALVAIARAFLADAAPDGEIEVPALAHALGRLPDGDERIRRVSAAPGAYRSALVSGVAAAITRRATGGLVLLIDDAQHADDVCLDALRRSASTAPIWVCLFSRRPLLTRELASEGRSRPTIESIDLEPLAAEPAAELCRHLLLPVVDLPRDAVERMVERSQGSPLLLEEVVRALRAAGAIRARSRGREYYLVTDALGGDLPVADWLVDGELSRIPPDLFLHACQAAVLGMDVAVEDASALAHELVGEGRTELVPLDPERALRSLVDRGVLVRHRESFRFRGPLLRDALLARLPADRAVPIHAAAAAFLERRLRDRPGDRALLARLAGHAAAGHLERAALVHADLADGARAAHAYLEAEALYGRTLDLLSGSAIAAELRARQGRALMRYRLGRYEDSLDDYRRARELCREVGDREAEVHVLLDEATALDWLIDFAESAERVERAGSLAAGLDSPLLAARLLMARGRCAVRGDRVPEAIELLERSVETETVSPLGPDGYETLVAARLLLLFYLPVVGRFEAAEELGEALTSDCAARGDRLHLMATYGNRASLHQCRGRLDLVIADLERAEALAVELGLTVARYRTTGSLAQLHFGMGDLATAAALAERAAELEAAGGARPGRILLLQAQIHAHEGRIDDARVAAGRAELGELSPEEAALLAVLRLGLSDPPDDSWRELRSDFDGRGVNLDEAIAEHRGMAALRGGRSEEAAVHLRQALALAEESASESAGRIRGSLAGLADAMQPAAS